MLGVIYRDLGNLEQAIRELSYTIRSAEKDSNEHINPIKSYWCPDDRPILEKDLLIKMSLENINHLQKTTKKRNDR